MKRPMTQQWMGFLQAIFAFQVLVPPTWRHISATWQGLDVVLAGQRHVHGRLHALRCAASDVSVS